MNAVSSVLGTGVNVSADNVSKISFRSSPPYVSMTALREWVSASLRNGVAAWTGESD